MGLAFATLGVVVFSVAYVTLLLFAFGDLLSTRKEWVEVHASMGFLFATALGICLLGFYAIVLDYVKDLQGTERPEPAAQLQLQCEVQ